MPLQCFIKLSCFVLLTSWLVQADSLGQTTVEQSAPFASKQFDFVGEVVQQHIREKKLVGAVTWVYQNGKVVHHAAHGLRDRDSPAPMERDAIFRIHSFTKAISTTAAMMLWEEGKFELDDPVSKYLPEFASQRVYDSAGNLAPSRAMTVRDLMRHTSGVIYANENGSEVEKAYDQAKLGDIDTSLEEFAQRLATLPLAFSPGEQWQYGMSVDLLGRLIEVWSGQPFEEYLRSRIFTPLAMKDTDFYVPTEKLDRLATLYVLDNKVLDDENLLQPSYGKEKGEPNYVPTASPIRCSPGGGLFSTADDYGTFLQMILAGGRFNNKIFLKPETVAMMTSDQLPESVPGVRFGEELRDGFKFGLGFNVITAASNWDPVARVGEFGWGGAASCHYWVLPQQKLIVITLESTMPYTRNLEQSLKGKIYQTLE